MIPAGGSKMAQDEGLSGLYGWAGNYGGMAGMSEGLYFPGYPYLAELTQRPEYRRGSEIIAREMTRKWIKLTAKGEADKSKKLAALEDAMKLLKVQDLFRRAAEHDGFFGRAQIYLDTGASEDVEKIPLIVNKATIGKGSLKRLVIVEPLWTYPTDYNSRDPLARDYYKPQSWYVMGRKVHASRFLTFVGRELPDILKPAYMFGGISLSQLGKPYVDNWIRTRQSVSDLVASFSQSGLKTNMMGALGGQPGTGVIDRVELLTNFRDNSNALVLDKESEEWFNVVTPLSTLDALQAQTQEHMSAVWGIPLIVFFGITPSGLNASTDGELEVWNTTVQSLQEHLFGPNLDVLLRIIQLSEFGEVGEDLTYTWESLGEVDQVKMAAVRKSDGDLAVSYISSGVLWPEEERVRLAGSEDSQYPGLDIANVPEPIESVDPGAEAHKPATE